MIKITFLKNIDDKHNYDGVSFVVSFDDIKIFEETNKVGVQIFTSEDNAIIKEYPGNKDYLLNDRVYLLRIEDDTKNHYVYIKHVHRLLHTNTHVSGADKTMCPYCNKMICCDDFENNHIKECYKIVISEGSLIK